ncbi:MAG: hypothetical protein AB7L66_04430 [Gemmatimonadales bacterium]
MFPKRSGQPRVGLSNSLFVTVITALAFCGSSVAAAQVPALAASVTSSAVIEYAANESGGRIRITSPAPDSVAVEAARAVLFEEAAAFRRGDLKALKLVRNDLPTMQILASRRGTIRCTVRLNPRGGDLVLLSDDSAVVAAIHQMLSSEPPRSASY